MKSAATIKITLVGDSDSGVGALRNILLDVKLREPTITPMVVVDGNPFELTLVQPSPEKPNVRKLKDYRDPDIVIIVSQASEWSLAQAKMWMIDANSKVANNCSKVLVCMGFGGLRPGNTDSEVPVNLQDLKVEADADIHGYTVKYVPNSAKVSEVMKEIVSLHLENILINPTEQAKNTGEVDFLESQILMLRSTLKAAESRYLHLTGKPFQAPEENRPTAASNFFRRSK